MAEQDTERREPLALTEEERDLVRSEVDAILPALSGQRREAYQALADATASGQVPPDLVPLLEGLIVLALETGRARRVHRAEGERILTELFRRTPRGREMSRELSRVNKALEVLRGQAVNSIHVAMRTLGHFTLSIETEAASITLAVRPDSVAVDSVAVGGEAGVG